MSNKKMDLDLGLPQTFPALPDTPAEEGGIYKRFQMVKAEYPEEVRKLRPYKTEDFPKSLEKTVFVAPGGCDGAAGDIENPLATIGAALEKIGCGGGVIYLRGGEYVIEKTIRIGEQNSGSDECPLIISAYADEKVLLSGGLSIPVSSFRHLDRSKDAKAAKKLKAEVFDKIVVTDLKADGITLPGGKEGGRGHFRRSPTFLFNGARQTVARYPNAGEPNIPMSKRIYETGGCSIQTSLLYTRDHEKTCPWEIGLDDDRPYTWEWNDDIWLGGALYEEWAHGIFRVAKIDPEKRSMTGAGISEWGVKYSSANGYYFFNVFEELDAPCEYFIDKESELLYYLPEEELKEDDDLRLITRGCNMFEINGAEYVILNGLDIGRTTGAGVTMSDSEQILVQNCALLSLGGGGVLIESGKHCGSLCCTADKNGGCSFRLAGGDRAHLIPANNFVLNSTVSGSYSIYGMTLDGCGNVISHCHIIDCSVSEGSNESIIEYCNFEGGWKVSEDAGMIYCGGGGLSCCGVHIRYNYFHDFHKCGRGVYCDDMSRGKYVYGNIVVGNGPDKEACSRAYNIHNGGEHVFVDNIALNPGWFGIGGDLNYYYDGMRCAGIFSVLADSFVSAASDKRNETYMGRYPEYKRFVAALDEYYAKKNDPDYVRGAAEDRVRAPANLCVYRNVVINAHEPFHFSEIARKTIWGLDHNCVLSTEFDAAFEDPDNKNYRLARPSVIYRVLPDFIAPPFRKMGRYN